MTRKSLRFKCRKLIELPTTLQYLGAQNRLIETTSLPTTLQCLDLQHCYGLTDIPLLPVRRLVKPQKQ